MPTTPTKRRASDAPGATDEKGDDVSASKTLTAADFANTQCPRCTVGVRQVVRFDPDALHEHGQTIEAGLNLSGGAVGYYCPACETGSSEPINPTQVEHNTQVSVKGHSNGRA